MANASGVVGRDEEIGRVQEFLGRTPALPAAMLIEGEAGIGKTTVWREAIDRAARQGYLVLKTSPSDVEMRLAFSALGDLLAEHLDARTTLPAAQRRALETALLLDTSETTTPDPRAIALAFLGILRSLAVSRVVLLAIDDVQWLDPPSRTVLEFALRRAGDAKVTILVARRTGGRDYQFPLGLGRAFPQERIASIALAPLSLGATHSLLAADLHATFRRPTLRRIHEISGGNPLYALELARALLREPDRSKDEDLPLPDSLRDAMHNRLKRLPKRTMEALTIAAISSEPTVDLLAAAMTAADVGSDLGPAVVARVIELDGDRIRFTHPLLASACRSSAAPRRKLELHRRLAELAPSAEERAFHLALGTLSPAADAAATVEAAARSAVARGAPDIGAELAEHARRLTMATDADGVRRRLWLAAESYWSAGDYDRGRVIFERIVSETPSAAERARARLRLATHPRNLQEAKAITELALIDAASEPLLRTEIQRWIAIFSYIRGDMNAGLRNAEAALESAHASRDDVAVAVAVATRAYLLVQNARKIDVAELEHAADVEYRARGFVYGGAGHLASLSLAWLDELDAADRITERLYRSAQEKGDFEAVFMLVQKSHIALKRGRHSEAKRIADAALELAGQFGLEEFEAETLAHKNHVDVLVGRIENARASVAQGLEAAKRADEPLGEVRHRYVAGLLEFSLGDYVAAARELERALEVLTAFGVRNPGSHPVAPLAAEALIGIGEVERADEVTRELDAVASDLATPRSLAVARRCRGLVLAARGDLDGAEAILNDALRHHDRFPVPFERARTLLCLGRVQRRAKRKRAARETLEAALGIFEELPAPLWAGKARAELARIGGHAPAMNELTASERHVTELVAKGRTNKEAAAELFVSVHTIEAALTRIYDKLGIRSRSELAGLLMEKRGSIGKM